ncbi:MAG: hypothetical protein JW925_02905 [Syntrophaceae bacterium]|nr:hypothetical protein [Syntrophaceae bacterium]
MSDEDEITTPDEYKHTASGYASVALTVVALIMLVAIRPMGIAAKDETGVSITFVAYLFVSMTLAIVGGFFGFLGLSEENAKKVLPVTGLVLAVIFITILAYTIFSSVK